MVKSFKTNFAFFVFVIGFFLQFSSCKKENNLPTDFWIDASPESQNIDQQSLTEISDKIEFGLYGNINSLLIVRNGFLVFEKYFNGYSRDIEHPVYSVTKSVTSLLIGIAIEQQLISSIDQKVISFFLEYPTVNHLTDDKKNIRLEDLLTMKSGFEWNEFDVPYDNPQNIVRQMSISNDWIKFILDRPMSSAPNEKYNYNSGNTILLSGILKNVSNLSAEEFAVRNLFSKLEIKNYSWETGPNKITNTGWGLRIRPREMAKFGLLILKNGNWNGEKIISEQWLSISTKKNVSLSRSFGYGYNWWMMPLTYKNFEPQLDEIKIAWGWGGQFIFIIPKLNLVVVSTASNYQGNSDELGINVLQDVINTVKDD